MSESKEGQNLGSNHQVTGSSPSTSAKSHNVQFSSTMTRATKAAQPKEYFAKQNAEREKKKQKQKKQAKMAMLIGIPIALVAVIAVVGVVVWMALRPEEEEPTPVVVFTEETIDEDMVELQDLAMGAFKPTLIYGEDGMAIGFAGNDEDTEAMFDATLSAKENKEYSSQINYAKVMFYARYGQYEMAIQAAVGVVPDNLSVGHRVDFYSTLSTIYSSLGDSENATRYKNLQYELTEEYNLGMGSD